MSSFCVHLFRDFAVRFDGEVVPALEGRKAKELFSYLLLNQERPHRRQQLMTLLWEDSTEAKAQKYLRQVLWQLQSVMNPYFLDVAQQLLEVDIDWVQINPQAGVWCDAIEFQMAYRLSQGTAGSLLDHEQARVLEEAVALYTGDLLEGWDQNWCLIEREHLQNMYLMILEKLMDNCEVHGRYEEGIEYGMRAIKLDYARERTYRRLMRLYSLLGDRNSAMRQYDQCVAALRVELDVAPSQRTQALFEMIRQDKFTRGYTLEILGKPVSASLHSRLVDHLMYLHADLGEMQSSIEREIEAVKQFYSSK